MLRIIQGRTVVLWGEQDDYYKIKFERLLIYILPDLYVSEEDSIFGKKTIRESDILKHAECFFVVCASKTEEIIRIKTILNSLNFEYCELAQLMDCEKKIRNMPVLISDGDNALFRNRQKAYWNLVDQFFAYERRPIRIMEIGVFKAQLIQGIDRFLRTPVSEYVGVDPYMGTSEDAYFGTYYSNHDDASSYYNYAKSIYANYDFATLYREKSIEYMQKAHENHEEYDVIIVDGDHRLEPCMADLKLAKKLLKHNGVLIVDDYANVDTKDVTNALNRFLRNEIASLEGIKYSIIQFQNPGKFVPASLTVVGIQFNQS